MPLMWHFLPWQFQQAFATMSLFWVGKLVLETYRFLCSAGAGNLVLLATVGCPGPLAVRQALR